MNKKKSLLYLIAAFLWLTTEGVAQVAINTDGSQPDPNAILDLTSTNKAFLPPRMTNVQIKAIPSPKEGMLAYDTDFKCLRMYSGSEWQCQQAANKELSDPPGDFSIFTTATGDAIYPRSTTTDAMGNVYVTGSFSSATLTLGSITLTNTSINFDVFVVKYNSSGVVLWAVKGSGGGAESGNGIAVDGNGNVYVTGQFDFTTAFGSTTLTNPNGDFDVFVVKYNSSGVVQWAVKGGGFLGTDVGKSIAVDGSGNVYVTGNFTSLTAIFGTTTLTNSNFPSDFQNSDVFVVKYNSSGMVQWAVKGGGIDNDSGNGIAVDGSGNVYVTGFFVTTVLDVVFFGATSLKSSGGSDVFVVKYNSMGVVQWAIKGGGSGGDGSSGIAIDVSDNIYITGGFSSPTATFGGANLTNIGGGDVFVVKYNSSGAVQWAVKGGGSSSDVGTGIAVDGSGNVYVMGKLISTPATFGSSTLTNVNNGVFVVKYNTGGEVQWAVRGGGGPVNEGLSIAVNASGTRVYTTVRYYPNVKFGNTILKTGNYLIWMYGE
jgi:Beta-propeller repeat